MGASRYIDDDDEGERGIVIVSQTRPYGQSNFGPENELNRLSGTLDQRDIHLGRSDVYADVLQINPIFRHRRQALVCQCPSKNLPAGL